MRRYMRHLERRRIRVMRRHKAHRRLRHAFRAMLYGES